MITLQAFEDRLDRYGGALERWPSGDRRDAEALLGSSMEARLLHAAMREAEAALALPASALPGTGDEAAARFAAIAARHAQERPAPQWSRRPTMRTRIGWGAAVAAALALGILVGNADLGVHDDSPDQVLAVALATTGTVDVD